MSDTFTYQRFIFPHLMIFEFDCKEGNGSSRELCAIITAITNVFARFYCLELDRV